MPADPTITLALGPTNTGKTHRAVERMLEHDSAVIGLPLRLLAREVYDRVSAKIGESRVALVTGEEKRVPAHPRYWVCTVEAMPHDVSADFVAIDEIQLAAHRERGHVFTDRLLHARGRRETWFLGADTIAPIARSLLPHAEFSRHPRLSTLRHSGTSGLGGLPPRTALVAFSADEVYELAGRLKRRKGGAAVVLGALSPRTRNAQVALYQSGEVRYLVATDAIGMGLNLDIDHVAFASLTKFDGRDRRPLEIAEIAQIAGRAGRYKRDGTFGTLGGIGTLDERVVRSIEEHRFAPIDRLVWRNSALNFSSVDALLTSLSEPVPSAAFSRVEQADDFDALRTLAGRPEVLERATNPATVALLWEVCQVPDYRKLLLLRHVGLIADLFVQLCDQGELDPAWVEGEVRRIDSTEGEIETLTARLSAIRVWTYVSHRAAWLGPHASHFRERTRAIEDRLSDALHERLVESFVELGKRSRTGRAEPIEPKSAAFASLADLLAREVEGERRQREGRIDAIVDAPHSEFVVRADGSIAHRDHVIGAVALGRELATPLATVTLGDEIGAGARSRIERRLLAVVKDAVAELVTPLEGTDRPPGIVRGLLYQLTRGLGTVRSDRARDQIAALDASDHEWLELHQIAVGERTVFARACLSAPALELRATLVRTFYRVPFSVPRGAVSIVRDRSIPEEAYLAAGFLLLGPRAVRVDQVERTLAELRGKDSAFRLPDSVGRWLGVKRAELPKVLAALRITKRDDGLFELSAPP